MPTEIRESERWFDQYLVTNGYQYEVEPNLGVRTRPDRLIERVGVQAICEIKEFTTDAMRRRFPHGGSGFASFSSNEWLLNVRRTISDAARQLEPLAGDARPLVIVLANPQGVIAEIEGKKLLEAMYGDLVVRLSVNPETGGPASEPSWELGPGGRLADEQAPWVSAVAGLHRGDRRHDWEQKWIEAWKAENPPGDPRSYEEAVARAEACQAALEEAAQNEEVPAGEYFRLDVIETMSEEAVPLPRNILDTDMDRRWVVNREAQTYELLAQPS